MRWDVVEAMGLGGGLRGVIKRAVSIRGELNTHDLILSKTFGQKAADVSLTRGWHTAYIILPRKAMEALGFPLDKPGLTETDIPVHGGCTYSEPYLEDCQVADDEWVLGWDYNHYGDTIEEYDQDVVREDVRELAGYLLKRLEEVCPQT